MLSLWILIACTAKKVDLGEDTSANDSTFVEEQEPIWVIVEEDYSAGVLMSIWGTADAELWVVGGQFDQGLVLRKIGEAFEEMPVPEGTPLLNWVHGTSAQDLWVVGLSGTILHWDGSEWQDYSLDIEEAIWGIHQNGDSVYCVGGESRWGGSDAKIFHLEGEQFTEIEIPSEYGSLSNLYKVGYWENKFWAVGTSGALIEMGDGEPTAVPTGIATDLVTIHDNQIVGGRGVGLVTNLEDGALTTGVQMPAGLNGVFQYEPNQLIVVGERGYGAFFDVNVGTYQEIPSVTLDILHATWVDSEGFVYAVGGNLFTSDQYFHGVILKMNGVQ